MENTKTPSRKKLYKVVVNNLMAEGQEKNNPIPVNDLGDLAHGRAYCIPNQETILSEVQINILKDAVEVVELPIPESSGILESGNIKAGVAQHFPGYAAKMDRQTGVWMMFKTTPRFSVQVIGPYAPKAKSTTKTKE